MSQQINLIDPSLRTKRDWLAARGVAAFGAVLGLAVAAHWAHEQARFNRILAAGAAAEVPPPPAGAAETPLQEAQRVIARGERLMQALAGLTDLPRDNAQRLRALVAAMPASLWLREVEFSGERGMRVAGGSTDAAALTDFAQRLGALPAFQGAPLFIFKVEPRAPAQSGDADAPSPPAGAGPALYAFVLSTQQDAVAEAPAR